MAHGSGIAATVACRAPVTASSGNLVQRFDRCREADRGKTVAPRRGQQTCVPQKSLGIVAPIALITISRRRRIDRPSFAGAVDLQRHALVASGVDERRLFEDRVSGSRGDRTGLGKAFAFIKTGDYLVVWKLDRLGRSLPHL